MALRSADFDFGPEPPDGGPGWEVFGELHARNPKLLLDEGDFEMVRIWSLYRGGGLGGVGHLPDSGGTLEQAAIMLDAFGVMSAAAEELRKERGE